MITKEEESRIEEWADKELDFLTEEEKSYALRYHKLYMIEKGRRADDRNIWMKIDNERTDRIVMLEHRCKWALRKLELLILKYTYNDLVDSFTTEEIVNLLKELLKELYDVKYEIGNTIFIHECDNTEMIRKEIDGLKIKNKRWTLKSMLENLIELYDQEEGE